MGRVVEINESLWAKLSSEGVLRGLIRDYLETEADRTLDAALARDVQSSGYREEDAVRLVRDYRKQVRTKPVGKVGEDPWHSRWLERNLAVALTESDTRAKLIDPALHAQGWTEDLIRREETAGAVEAIEGQPRKRAKGRVD